MTNWAAKAADLTENFSENPAVLPSLLGSDEAADRMLVFYEESGREGATFSLHFGDMRGQPLYAVSLYPERARRSTGNAVSARILQLFITDNLDLLADSRCSVGLWYNEDEDVTYRDIIAALPDRQEAMTLALRYDQIAIFDLLNLNEIETGGTGNIPSDIPPAADRLPQMNQQEEQL